MLRRPGADVNARTAWSLALLLALASRAVRAPAQPVPSPVPAQATEDTFAGLGADVARAVGPGLAALPAVRAYVALRVTGGVPEGARAAVEAALCAGVSVVRAQGGSAEGGRVDVLATGDSTDAAVAAARTADDDVLVYVTLSSEGGTLTAGVTVLRVQDDPWTTWLLTVLPPAVTVQSVTAARRVDAAARAVLGAAPAVRWPAVPAGRPRVIATPFHGTVALAVGDLDGDHRDELVVVTTDRVRVARLSGASLAFVPDGGNGGLGAMGWAGVPPRQALGSAVYLREARVVLVRTSAQRMMASVTLANGALSVTPMPAADYYPAQGYGCVGLTPGGDAVALTTGCAGGTGTGFTGTVAVVPVVATVTDAAGGAHRVEARSDGAGSVEVRLDGARVETLTDAAPPLVLDDLDGDGRIELLTAAGGEPDAADRLRVFTVGPGGTQERQGWTVPGPVEGIAVGDLDGDGLPEVIVAALDPQRHATSLWVLP